MRSEHWTRWHLKFLWFGFYTHWVNLSKQVLPVVMHPNQDIKAPLQCPLAPGWGAGKHCSLSSPGDGEDCWDRQWNSSFKSPCLTLGCGLTYSQNSTPTHPLSNSPEVVHTSSIPSPNKVCTWQPGSQGRSHQLHLTHPLLCTQPSTQPSRQRHPQNTHSRSRADVEPVCQASSPLTLQPPFLLSSALSCPAWTSTLLRDSRCCGKSRGYALGTTYITGVSCHKEVV